MDKSPQKNYIMKFSPQDVFIHQHRHCLFQARRECTFCTEGSFRCRSRKHRAALSSVSPADRDGKSRGPHWGRDHQEGASSLLNYFCDKIDFLQFFAKDLLTITCKVTIFLNLNLFTITRLPSAHTHTHTTFWGLMTDRYDVINPISQLAKKFYVNDEQAGRDTDRHTDRTLQH